MTKLLSGKIYWVLGDFSVNGTYYHTKEEDYHIINKIVNAVVDENMIKFSTTPPPPDEDDEFEYISYDVNLLVNETGINYRGNFINTLEDNAGGKVSCELFENKKTYFLYGKWEEKRTIYTWWARIEKPRSGLRQF